ncbi:MAG TPA: ABC-type transport auxiliary lipoprotein family protein [Steroidobacteraceae bacterium]|nr:ABC-type transport auxiliary lipoprotein family protein [Steroidobacteraceae bacterium]
MTPGRYWRFVSSRAALLLCAVSLGGCIGAGLHSNQPQSQQYLLSAFGAAGAVDAATANTDAANEAPAAAPAGALDAARSLEVLLPAAAPGLEGDGIAVLRAGGRLDYYTGAHWAAAAPQMLQTLAIETLRRQGRFALVESDSAPFAANWELQLELTHFEADYAGSGPPTVHVGLIATLGERSARRAVTTLSIETHAVAQDDRMHAVVAAFQSATREALQEIGTRLAPPGQPAPLPSQP